MSRVHTFWAAAALFLAVVSFWLGRAQTAELRARVLKLEAENRSLRQQLGQFQIPEQFDIESNERVVLRAIRTINTAVIAYAVENNTSFPASLSDLRAEGRSLLDSYLAAGNSSGYRITYQPSEADSGSGLRMTYELSARPLRYEETGRRSFFSDESGLIRATSEPRAATKSDPPL